MATGNRPWEGTALGVVDIIGVVGAFLFAIMFLFLQGIFSGLGNVAAEQGEVAASGLMGMFGGFGLAVGFIFIALGILSIFMARGAFKGQKWSPIVSIVLCGLGLLSSLPNLGDFNAGFAVGLLLNIFVIYCGVMCMKSPYYK